MYSKIIKYIEWALLLISVAIILWGVFAGLESNGGTPIDVMLYWAYALVAIAVLAIVGIGLYISAQKGAKSLLKIGLVVIVAAALVGISFLLAPASPAIGITGAEPTHSALKLTDAVLNLTYIVGSVSIIAIVYSAIANSIRK